MRSLNISTVLVTILLAATLTGGCALDGPTAVVDDQSLSARRAAPAAMVPFVATYNTAPNFTPVAPEVCATELADITQGAGDGTSAAGFTGAFTGTTFSCVDLPNLVATDGRFHFTAIRGEQVTGTYSLTGEWIEPGVLLAVTGPFAITGGTGRVNGATGSGTCHFSPA
jgi:hypothetical protein